MQLFVILNSNLNLNLICYIIILYLLKEFMQLYFGVVSTPYISDEDTYFTDKGVCYYYKITEDADSLYLEDTCGRVVPIDKESVRDAAFSLMLVLSASDAYNAVDVSVAKLIKEYEATGL